MKAVVAAFNQEKALVGTFSVITNLRMELFEALMDTALIASISICQSTHPVHGGLAGGESGYFQCRNRTAAGYIGESIVIFYS